MIHLSAHQKAWEALVTAVGRRDLLEEPRFATRKDRWENHYDIVPILQAEFEKKPRDHWLEALDAVNVPNAPIYKIDEVLDDPQVKELGLPQGDPASQDGVQQPYRQRHRVVRHAHAVSPRRTVVGREHRRDPA